MFLWFPIIKRKEITMQIMFIPIKIRTLILKMVEREVFSMKPKHQYHLSQEKNVSMVPNNEKTGDYYVNLCLSKLTYDH